MLQACRCLSESLLRLQIPLGVPAQAQAAARTQETGESADLQDDASTAAGGIATCTGQAVSTAVVANTWPPFSELQKTDQVLAQANDPEYWCCFITSACTAPKLLSRTEANSVGNPVCTMRRTTLLGIDCHMPRELLLAECCARLQSASEPAHIDMQLHPCRVLQAHPSRSRCQVKPLTWLAVQEVRGSARQSPLSLHAASIRDNTVLFLI